MERSPGKIYVLGIGYKAFDKREREIILEAGVILASERLYDVFKRYGESESVKDRIEVIGNVDATISFLRSHLPSLDSHAVILASGDPLFYGIGRRAVVEFGKERVEIIPDLSSVQLAFARIKEPWDDALLMSLHHGPDAAQRRIPRYTREEIPALLEAHETIAVLTDRENNPAEIAKTLARAYGPSGLTMHVCERLGYPEERVVTGTAGEIAKGQFVEPNVVIIVRRPIR